MSTPPTPNPRLQANVLFVLGLALAESAAGLGKRADVRIRRAVAPEFGRLNATVAIVLFRVAQESLANVLRHSGSDAATIRLSRDDTSIVLEIQDYGRGLFAGEPTPSGARGVGIAAMRERLQQLGGRLELRWSKAWPIAWRNWKRC